MAREDSRIATVRMHKQIYQQVERRAELQGMSVSGYLGRVITRHIEATPEPTVQEAIDMLEPAALRAVGGVQHLVDVLYTATEALQREKGKT